jgi:hypothetical protein
MRIARKLMLLAMLAVAAAAVAAPSAFAQNEPLAHNQTPRLIVAQEVHAATDVPCPAVTPSPAPNPTPLVTAGGCRFHVVGTAITFAVHDAAGNEILVFTCNWEFDVRVDSAGEGYISHQEFTQGAAGTCTRRACGQVTPPTSEGRAFSFFMQETEPAPRERAVVLFCTEPIGAAGASHCEVTIPLTQPALHRYTFTANDASGHPPAVGIPRCELNGTFNQEAALGTTGENQAEQNVEIRHT